MGLKKKTSSHLHCTGFFLKSMGVMKTGPKLLNQFPSHGKPSKRLIEKLPGWDAPDQTFPRDCELGVVCLFFTWHEAVSSFLYHGCLC